jgi:hypothetical protein
MMMRWNCVGCDAQGEVEVQLSTTFAELLTLVLLQHETETPNCPLVRDGVPQLSIWEPQNDA